MRLGYGHEYSSGCKKGEVANFPRCLLSLQEGKSEGILDLREMFHDRFKRKYRARVHEHGEAELMGVWWTIFPTDQDYLDQKRTI